jgi:hypothetical protein
VDEQTSGEGCSTGVPGSKEFGAFCFLLNPDRAVDDPRGSDPLQRIATSKTFDVRLTLTAAADTSNSMNFQDTYENLDDTWYEFSADAEATSIGGECGWVGAACEVLLENGAVREVSRPPRSSHAGVW